MNRRAFVAGLGAVLAAPLVVEAQPAGKVPRVALLFAATPVTELLGPTPTSPSARGFVEGMRELGWVDGQNVSIERKSADGDPNRYLPLVLEMISLKVDVLVVSGGPQFVAAAHQATRTIPIVMAGLAGDPVKMGVAQSFAAPGGNVTGSTFTAAPGLGGKRLQLLREIVPAISRVAFLYAPDSATEHAARALGITILQVPIDVRRGIAAALSGVVQNQCNALMAGGETAWARHREIIDFAAKHRLPALYSLIEYVPAGGLMAYGANYMEIFRRAAGYVDKILKGVKAGDLPIEQPTKFELVINRKTAKALGLTIPPSLLLRADQVIE